MPIVTHVHGAVGVGDESDGYAEAWYLPAANNIPAGYATEGTWYNFFAGKAAAQFGVTWGPGFAIFQYPNAEPRLDHLVPRPRAGHDAPERLCRPGRLLHHPRRSGGRRRRARQPLRHDGRAAGPAPKENDKFPPNKTYYEIPIADPGPLVQHRRLAVLPGHARVLRRHHQAPYIPDTDISPIWNPEFFGNMIMVNGNTWPFQTVEQRRYRFRFLNGCQSRFLILDFSNIPGVEVWQIGNEGGFLAAPVNLTATNGNRLLMGLAERADVIVDFTNVPVGNYVLGNVGPDEPFGGGVPGVDFAVADPATTGQVMQFRVVPAVAPDPTTPPQFLVLPPITPLPAATVTRPLALIEEMSDVLRRTLRSEALLGHRGRRSERRARHLDPALMWMDPVTENPAVGATEVWELYNATADAHPMHIHEIVFEVVNRQDIFDRRRGLRQLQVARVDADAARALGDAASRTRSSPIPARSRACGRSSTRRASSSGTATSSSTRTMR